MNSTTSRNARRGFTLAELLVVVGVLLLVMAGIGIGAYFLIKFLFLSGSASAAMLGMTACLA